MTGGVQSCQPSASLAEAVGIMWKADCGIVPVVNERSEVIGVVTDRDIAIALGTRGARASELQVGKVMSTTLVTCAPEDPLTEALGLMQRHQVRRLPVVGIGGVLLGMLSVNDVIVHTPQPKTSDPLVAALRGICRHHHELVAAG
jgi:CBS domain-containing protein